MKISKTKKSFLNKKLWRKYATESDILLTKNITDKKIYEITLNNVSKRNSLSFSLLSKLDEQFEYLSSLHKRGDKNAPKVKNN